MRKWGCACGRLSRPKNGGDVGDDLLGQIDRAGADTERVAIHLVVGEGDAEGLFKRGLGAGDGEAARAGGGVRLHLQAELFGEGLHQLNAGGVGA